MQFYPKNISNFVNTIRNSLALSTGAVHFDETSMHVDKKRQWLHVAANEILT